MTFASTLWLPLLGAFLGAPLLALAALGVVTLLLERLLARQEAPLLLALLRQGKWSLRVTVALLAVVTTLPAAPLAPGDAALAERLLTLALTAALGWTVTRKVAAAFDARLAGDMPGDEEVEQRRHRTQLVVFRRLAVAGGIAFTAGFVLTAIPAVRTVGLSLFASAGVAGIVVGIAARPAVSNIIAGLQIALTQPIRIGDAVQVEGQWGRVQELTSSYVTITTWDERSLVVPLSWFVEKPVLNWTKDGARLLDTVFFYLDHAAPVQAIREEVERILAAAPQWDGRVGKVQVTNMKESCIELRILLSASDPSRMFELRCLVREKLLAWLLAHHAGVLLRSGGVGLAAT